jgi:ABC-type antimicrobial peptide transport system permease subunit
MADGVRRALQPVMPGQQYVTVRPMAGLLDQRRRSWQVGATMFLAFGALALAVAAVGLYGVIAYDVAQRKHELGVRVALGAQEGDILRLVLRHGLRLAIAGVAIGVGVALAASRWIQPLLFRQSATDPLVYAVVGAVMIAVALTASALPAFRAARSDPNLALRAE